MDFSFLHEKFLNTPDLMQKLNIYRTITMTAINDKNFRLTIDKDKFHEATDALSKLGLEPKIEGKSIAIIGLNNAVGFWDPSSVDGGLPGSEECVVYAAQELANRGYKVVVYMNPAKDSIYTSFLANPRWLPIGVYVHPSHKPEYDCAILWRNNGLHIGRLHAKKCYYWAHDIVNGDPEIPMPPFDGALILSKYSESSLNKHRGFSNIPRVICGNGVVLSHFSKPMSFTNPLSIGYYSNYARGLEILINSWEYIHGIFPTAVLNICYGRQHWGSMPEAAFKKLCDKIDSLKEKNIGIIEHGKVGHLELAEIMQKTSIWSYSCLDFGETFCITAVKAQLAGNIPVTTRLGALNETVHPNAPHIDKITNVKDIVTYVQLLVKVMQTIRDAPREIIEKERKVYIEFAKQFSWEKCVGKMLTLMDPK